MNFRLPFILMLMASGVSASPPSEPDIVFSQTDVRRYNLRLGQAVFEAACTKCHGDEEASAPQLGDLDAWETRIQDPLDTLIERAIRGHGDMPPRGDVEWLSDREVAAAVAYVVDQGRRLLTREGRTPTSAEPGGCDPLTSPTGCGSERLQDTLVLEMLWRLTGQHGH